MVIGRRKLVISAVIAILGTLGLTLPISIQDLAVMLGCIKLSFPIPTFGLF